MQAGYNRWGVRGVPNPDLPVSGTAHIASIAAPGTSLRAAVHLDTMDVYGEPEEISSTPTPPPRRRAITEYSTFNI